MIVEWASIYSVSDYLRKPGRDMWCQYQTIWWTQNLVLHPGTLVRPTSYVNPWWCNNAHAWDEPTSDPTTRQQQAPIGMEKHNWLKDLGA